MEYTSPEDYHAVSSKNISRVKRGEYIVFCTNCGKQLPEGSQFCPACGTQVYNVEAAKAGSDQTVSAGQPEKTTADSRKEDVAGKKSPSQNKPRFRGPASAGSWSGRHGKGRKIILVVVLAAVLVGIALGVRAMNEKTFDMTARQVCYEDAKLHLDEIQDHYADRYSIDVSTDAFKNSGSFETYDDPYEEGLYRVRYYFKVTNINTDEHYAVDIQYVVKPNFLRTGCSFVGEPTITYEVPPEAEEVYGTSSAYRYNDFDVYAGEYILYSEHDVRVIVENMYDNEHLAFYYYFDDTLMGVAYAYQIYEETWEGDAQFYPETVDSDVIYGYLSNSIFMINCGGTLTISTGEYYECLSKVSPGYEDYEDENEKGGLYYVDGNGNVVYPDISNGIADTMRDIYGEDLYNFVFGTDDIYLY